MKYWMLLFALLWVSYGTGMARKTEKVVNNGIPWFDDRGEIVNAHGACIVEENGRYYLFGEYKTRAMLFRVSVVIHLMIW